MNVAGAGRARLRLGTPPRSIGGVKVLRTFWADWRRLPHAADTVTMLHDQSLMARRIKRRGRIQNLSTHPAAYVTVSELAEYWLVSRRIIYKQIAAGTLHTIKLGPRLLRIRTVEAVDFERRASMHRPAPDTIKAPVVESHQLNHGGR